MRKGRSSRRIRAPRSLLGGKAPAALDVVSREGSPTTPHVAVGSHPSNAELSDELPSREPISEALPSELPDTLGSPSLETRGTSDVDVPSTEARGVREIDSVAPVTPVALDADVPAAPVTLVAPHADVPAALDVPAPSERPTVRPVPTEERVRLLLDAPVEPLVTPERNVLAAPLAVQLREMEADPFPSATTADVASPRGASVARAAKATKKSGKKEKKGKKSKRPKPEVTPVSFTQST
ncbi:MAG TPA: hypothetical protein VM580_00920, partial [Labilithrix sp.]|nr:hypothetical protein [Labilithrix sp.]